MKQEAAWSMLKWCGYSDEDINSRVKQVWYEIFEGPNAVYHENEDGLGYVVDTGNDDVRTEGMSYAMMLAVQYDRKDIFDKIWGWVMRFMYMNEGHHRHYFAWSVAPNGIPNAQGPAPDGEEFFATSLFLASRRWGDGDGIYQYSAMAREILRYCVHKGESERGSDFAGEPMWNPDNKLIKFIPETEWSDPSYHVPHFYDLFAEEADPADRAFWKEAAEASRKYLLAACNTDTGMSPEYANYDGTPHISDRGHWYFFSDAYRTAANIGLDSLWVGKDIGLGNRVSALQRFFLTHDRTSVYEVDGTPVEETVLHPVGFIAATVQGSLAAIHSDAGDAVDNARKWVDLLWNTPMRIGARRYYDNFLYAFAMLALSGNYRQRW